jgi:methylase of polypeptide subunit release factors
MGTLRGTSHLFVEGAPSPLDAPNRDIVDFSFRHLQPGSILELGGGNGAYSLALQNAGRPATVADINPLHLEVARSAGLETLLVDPDQIFPDSSWDNVLMIEVL